MDTKESEIKKILKHGETLDVEFKSDVKGLPDRDLVATVVAMANTEGGLILLGVEDDGTVTGVQPGHLDATGLNAMIANRTSPSVAISTEIIELDNKKILGITVLKSHSIVSTTDGLVLRRRLMVSGKPEAVPFYPHEFIQRQAALGLIDPSAMPLVSLTAEDLNPLERQRIREAIRRYGGDMTLLPLADEELDGALGFVTTIEGVRRPTVLGLLFLGREEIIRRHIPAHEVAFQILEGTDVRVNEFFRKPFCKPSKKSSCFLKLELLNRKYKSGFSVCPFPILTAGPSVKVLSMRWFIVIMQNWALCMCAWTMMVLALQAQEVLSKV